MRPFTGIIMICYGLFLWAIAIVAVSYIPAGTPLEDQTQQSQAEVAAVESAGATPQAANASVKEFGEIAYNAKAKTALLSGGIAGGISLLWGFLILSRQRWAVVTAIASTLLFSVAFAWRTIAGWTAYSDGASHKWYAATLISIMCAVSLIVLVILIIDLLDKKQDTAEPQAT
jgi:uncharacterized membrane protein